MGSRIAEALEIGAEARRLCHKSGIGSIDPLAAPLGMSAVEATPSRCRDRQAEPVTGERRQVDVADPGHVVQIPGAQIEL
jgi:hypothetical protein